MAKDSKKEVGFFTRLLSCGSGQVAHETNDSDNAPLTVAQRYARDRQEASHQTALRAQQERPSLEVRGSLEALYMQLRDHHMPSLQMMDGIKDELRKRDSNEALHAENLKQIDHSLDSVAVIMKTALHFSKARLGTRTSNDYVHSLSAGIRSFHSSVSNMETNHALPENVKQSFEQITGILHEFKKTHLSQMFTDPAAKQEAVQEQKEHSPRALPQVASASSHMDRITTPHYDFHRQVTGSPHHSDGQKPSFSERHSPSTPEQGFIPPSFTDRINQTAPAGMARS